MNYQTSTYQAISQINPKENLTVIETKHLVPMAIARHPPVHKRLHKLVELAKAQGNPITQ